MDVNTADDNPVIGTRSFGADPARVAAHSAAAVTGLQAAGVAACAKHFPGHGATVADSHHELPTVDVPLDVLRRRDLPPFAAVVAAGARAVMTAHIRVPALTGDRPATFSRAVLVDLLRTEYGFTGTVITDALEMKGAAVAAGGVGPAAVRALAAGADLLCIGAEVDAELVERVAAEIVGALADGRLDRARVEEAAGRTAALAAWTRAAGATPAAPTDLGYAAARRAVRVEGVLTGLDRPLVVQLHAASTIAEGRVPWGLGPHLDGAEELRVVATETEPAALRAARRGPADRAGRPAPAPAARRRRPGRPRWPPQHPVTVVEMGWPSRWRPAGRTGLRHHVRREPRLRPGGRRGARPGRLTPAAPGTQRHVAVRHRIPRPASTGPGRGMRQHDRHRPLAPVPGRSRVPVPPAAAGRAGGPGRRRAPAVGRGGDRVPGRRRAARPAPAARDRGRPAPEVLPIDTSLAGRAFTQVEVHASPGPPPRLWVPIVNGTDRLGLLEVFPPADADLADEALRDGCRLISGLVGHLVTSKRDYGDALHRARRSRPMEVSAELLWNPALPPLTFATSEAVVSALLEPCYEVGGDAFDYAVHDGTLTLGDPRRGRPRPAGGAHHLGGAGRAAGGPACRLGPARPGRGRWTPRLPPSGSDARFVTAVLAEFDTGSGTAALRQRGAPAAAAAAPGTGRAGADRRPPAPARPTRRPRPGRPDPIGAR